MTTKTLMTAEELLAQSEQFGPCELVRGEIVPMTPAGPEHSGVAFNTGFLLSSWARHTRWGRVWGGETGLVTEHDPDTVRGADVVCISYTRCPKGQRPESFLAIPPELVVEVVGKRQSWRHVVHKVGEYLGFGVERIWVIDPKNQTVHVYRPDEEPKVFTAEDTLTDKQVLPEFSCKVAEFFED